MIEQCQCSGAICAHGLCTRCDRCDNCGAEGRAYYEGQLAGTSAGEDADRGMLGDEAAYFDGDVGNK